MGTISENGSPASPIAEYIAGAAICCDFGSKLPRVISKENGSRNFRGRRQPK